MRRTPLPASNALSTLSACALQLLLSSTALSADVKVQTPTVRPKVQSTAVQPTVTAKPVSPGVAVYSAKVSIKAAPSTPIPGASLFGIATPSTPTPSMMSGPSVTSSGSGVRRSTTASANIVQLSSQAERIPFWLIRKRHADDATDSKPKRASGAATVAGSDQ